MANNSLLKYKNCLETEEMYNQIILKLEKHALSDGSTGSEKVIMIQA